MIVTIDGPAGAGKSTVARGLAQRLGFRFLDTGAMYRAVGLAALRQGIDLRDERRVGELAQSLDLQLDLDHGTVRLNGEDVTEAIRQGEVTAIVGRVADNLTVRTQLSQRQRQLAAGGRVVTEGRDQGTVVFPEADCKIFLTATAAERAQRRCQELQGRGQDCTYDEVLGQQARRDHEDSVRPVGRLQPAEDAVEFVTDGLSASEVIDRLELLVRQRGLGGGVVPAGSP